jgi:hypothetical protein
MGADDGRAACRTGQNPASRFVGVCYNGRVRCAFISVLLLTAGAIGMCLSVTAFAASPAAPAADGLTINVFYTSNSLQAQLSNGTALNPGTVVPAGLYSVVVYDSGEDANPQFTMTGPGAAISSDLDPTGMEIDVPVTFGPFALAPSASYTIYDANLGSGSAIAFTTSATVSPPSASTTGSSGSGETPSSGSASGKAKTLGTLVMSVGTNGKPSLTLGAKPVKTLKPGKYGLIVGDSSKKAGILIGRGTARPSTLSGTTAVGTSSRTLTLTAGRWFFEPSTRGPKSYFTVT